MDTTLSLDQQERLLLAQQQRGHRRLRFIDELEPKFVEQRFRYIQQHWGQVLVVVAAVAFHLAYAVIDFVSMPFNAALSVLPLRLFNIGVILFSCLYYRHPKSKPGPAQFVFAACYLLVGLNVVALIYLRWLQGQAMLLEELYLLLLFGYVLLPSLPFRAICVCGWTLYAAFMLLGLWLGQDSVIFADQLLFLGCTNLIGTTGAYLLEHGHRSAWLNLRLLNIARRRAERDDASRTRLLATVSHDLRQPLNAMGLYTQHLCEHASEPEVLRVSANLQASVAQLGQMLESVLDYTRLSLSPTSIEVHAKPMPLRPLLARLAGEARAEIDEKGLEIRLGCRDDLWVRSDPVLLERLLRNLLSNALRHASARNVWLVAEQEAAFVSLEVGDDGCGLDQAEQSRAFDEFCQLGVTGDQGYGLGLSIVRQLASLLDYPLHLISAKGEGTRFRLQLPAAARRIPEPGVAASGAAVGRVLLIEDDPAGRQALQGLLERWGCQVGAFADAEQALQDVEPAWPQLLISDYRLAEGEDGLRTLERLREAAGWMVPALLISAEVNPGLRERCTQAHVTLLSKPLLPARLRQALTRLMSAREQPVRSSGAECVYSQPH